MSIFGAYYEQVRFFICLQMYLGATVSKTGTALTFDAPLWRGPRALAGEALGGSVARARWRVPPVTLGTAGRSTARGGSVAAISSSARPDITRYRRNDSLVAELLDREVATHRFGWRCCPLAPVPGSTLFVTSDETALYCLEFPVRQTLRERLGLKAFGCGRKAKYRLRSPIRCGPEIPPSPGA